MATMENSIFTPEELTQWNTLKYACSNDPVSFKILLNFLPDNIVNGVVENKNLLFIACGANVPIDSVKHLLSCDKFTDANINATNNDAVNTFFHACQYNSKAVEYLLNSPRVTDQTINATNRWNSNALHMVCCYQPKAVKPLLDSDRFSDSGFNAINNFGCSTLYYACEAKDVQSVKYLLSTNKLTLETIKAKTKNGGVNVLDIARQQKSEEIIKELENYIEKLNDELLNARVQNVELINIQLQIENTELKQKIAQLELEKLEKVKVLE